MVLSHDSRALVFDSGATPKGPQPYKLPLSCVRKPSRSRSLSFAHQELADIKGQQEGTFPKELGQACLFLPIF